MKFLTLGLLLLLAGCFTPASHLTKISIGMTKAEVITRLGTPSSVAAQQGGAEYLNYLMANRGVFTPGYAFDTSDFFVRLVDGRVESYGRRGDFNHTKDPTQNLNIKIQQQQLPPPATNSP